jgi:glutaconate CoA-transferase subunit A
MAHAHLARPVPSIESRHADIARSLDDALAPISDGCVLAVPRESSGVAMAATRALIRRGVKRLHLIALPTVEPAGRPLDRRRCVETLETSAVSLVEFGSAPRYHRRRSQGLDQNEDATCPALHAAFQASEKGVRSCRCAELLGTTAEEPAGLEGDG